MLVFADGERIMGLMVDEIIDVVEDTLHIELSAARPGLLGTAVIGGAATDVLDTGYWLTQALAGLVPRRAAAGRSGGAAAVLVVEDSDFFRQLLVPDPGRRRLRRHRRRQRGRGAAAARRRHARSTPSSRTSRCRTWTGWSSPARVRAGGAWADLPLIALTGARRAARHRSRARAGFTDYVAKFEREALLASLQQCLSEPVAA